MEKLAVWLSTPHHAFIEIARDLGYRRFVLDIEHGLFELDATDKLVALIRAMGLEVYAKVLGPDAVPIQQALDMGCHGVIIPHIGDAEHAGMSTPRGGSPPGRSPRRWASEASPARAPPAMAAPGRRITMARTPVRAASR